MIHLDTSVLVDALTGPRRSLPRIREAIEQGERIGLSALALYEWLRGARAEPELADQEALFPRQESVPFGALEAALAADLYREVSRPRGREIDLAVAACAILHGASLWTLNPRDFRDIPGLRLFEPPTGP
ncbi:MAG: type II toxin-antitoxin system VapC family toxin [Acidobacteria bacterium]|nr:type II toxin-antitoxin system VapC family toxin [Acidobacteriota bacterium]